MPEPFRLGIAGLGTVGTGVVKIIQEHGALLAARAGRAIEIVAVSARNPLKERGIDLSRYEWVDDAQALAGRTDIDAVVELIGGSEGLARALVEGSLQAGKHVITANKALLAHHGYALAQCAEENSVCLSYEAAAAGGIPIIKALREGFAGNNIQAVYGILNGTCNYILTAMRESGRNFSEVLLEAQERGYAESDPSFDVDGVDAAHKLCLLTSLSFGVKPDFNSLKVKGIRRIDAMDITFAQELGYRIKLLGIARRLNGKIMQVLEPCLVPVDSPLGVIEDVYNAVYVEGDFVSTQLLTGRGAGEGPTGSAVISDIVDLARGQRIPAFGVVTTALKDAQWKPLGETVARFYIRLSVFDRAGVIADISAILRDMNISIESLIQRGRDPGQPVPIVLTTHESPQGAVMEACDLFSRLEAVVDEPCLIRIEDFK
ncbi:MAG: homoserine dehydrogenase [Alphaproteobacteria bacterium]|nr:homoserine dehydrogenase [Alphaproteobacteria bacterium]